MILDGGMNVSKLENIVDKYVNIRKFYKSRIDFGLVTVNLTNLKARSMTKKNIPQNKLKDYLLASATCFPAFKTKKIDDKTYIDGGYYDNLSINLAVEMGADNIIAVDLRSVGLKRRIKYKDIKLTVIVPRNDLGSFLVFNPDLARRAMKFGYNDTITEEERYETKKTLGAQRIKDYKNGYYATQGGNPEERPTGALFLQQYWDYYKTDRGYHKRSLNSNKGWITTAQLSLLNTKILAFTNEIQNAVLMIHGEKAHSKYMGETAYQQLTTANKEFKEIPNAYHVDLYDNLDVIPFDYISQFINNNLNK
jgi:hypothetical protein